MKKRSTRGQSMVEYGLGIGCVAAVCMVALSGLGHAAGDITRTVLQSVNDADDQVGDPGWVVNPASTPWAPK